MEVMIGQIAPFFQPFRKRPIPKDNFMQKFYPFLYYSLLSERANDKFGFKYEHENNQSHLENGVYNRRDCFQFVYDIGNQWIHNVYFENSTPITNCRYYHKDAIYCKYLNGFTMCPPEDNGGIFRYYYSLLKCYDAYDKPVKCFDTKMKIYEWIETRPEYYKICCMSKKDDGSCLGLPCHYQNIAIGKTK